MKQKPAKGYPVSSELHKISVPDVVRQKGVNIYSYIKSTLALLKSKTQGKELNKDEKSKGRQNGDGGKNTSRLVEKETGEQNGQALIEQKNAEKHTGNIEEKNNGKKSFLSFFSRKKEETHKVVSAADIFKRRKEREKQKKGNLKDYLLKAGLEVESHIISKKIFNLAILINFLISLYLIYRFSTDLKIGVFYVTLSIAFVWIFVFFAILFLLWLMLFITIDLKIFKRRVDIEDVLPDYLQLTSANIRAGMPIDQALWYAVRPRFGVLANEIETVAKETISGVELSVALKKFSDKYDSPLLKRSINLLIEGLEAGGEVGDLLNKISLDIQKIQLLKREMSANVTTYVIFISVATVLVSPFLFALSGQLLQVITKIITTIKLPSAGQGAIFPVRFSEVGITHSDFTIFAIVSLVISSFFSAMIVATIRKGDVKSGIKYIPIFIALTVTLYFVYSAMFSGVFGSIF